MFADNPVIATLVCGTFLKITFVPKPNLVSTVPGMDVCELLPKHARWMNKSAVVRSVNHKGGCHNPMPSLTGYPEPLPSIGVNQDGLPPSMGSVCEYLNDDPSGMPDYVHMPCMLGWGQHIRRAGPYAGFLGRQYDPLFTECHPTSKKPGTDYHPQVVLGTPTLPNARLPKGITLDRLNSRKKLTEQFDDALRQPGVTSEFDRVQDGALSLLTSNRIRNSFDVESEKGEVRDKYGRTLFGNSALIARKLVEEGVRFVNVTWDCYYERLKLQYECWDTHKRNAGILRGYNLPVLDMTYNALMEDLEKRGLLDETLVVVMSDFGRTPKHNKDAGRDHWTACQSIVLAGGGIRGGVTAGQSDEWGYKPLDRANPTQVYDLHATMLHLLGIDHKQLLSLIHI